MRGPLTRATTTLAGAVLAHQDRLAGRVAVRRAFRLYTGVGASPGGASADRRIRVAYRRTGQPYLPAAPALFCSIAHSCGRAVAGISSHPIGVDIERIRRHRPALLAAIATPAEISRVSRHVREAGHLVTAVWTIKEAVMKATGVGLRITARRVHIEGFDGRGARVRVAAPNVAPATFWVAAVRRGRYYVSIAQPEGSDAIPRVDWDKPSRLPASRHADSA